MIASARVHRGPAEVETAPPAAPFPAVYAALSEQMGVHFSEAPVFPSYSGDRSSPPPGVLTRASSLDWEMPNGGPPAP
jgi:hypothetical protein